MSNTNQALSRVAAQLAEQLARTTQLDVSEQRWSGDAIPVMVGVAPEVTPTYVLFPECVNGAAVLASRPVEVVCHAMAHRAAEALALMSYEASCHRCGSGHIEVLAVDMRGERASWVVPVQTTASGHPVLHTAGEAHSDFVEPARCALRHAAGAAEAGPELRTVSHDSRWRAGRSRGPRSPSGVDCP
jgi:hypothetical protein